MEELLVPIITYLAIVGGCAWGIFRSARAKSERWIAEIHDRLAERPGSTFERKPRGAQLTAIRILWSFETDAGLSRVYAEGSRHKDTFTIHARARYLLPVGPRFSVSAESFFDSVAKEYAATPERLDTRLGYRPFDEHFFVKSDDPELTRRVWSEKAQRLMIAHFASGRVSSDGERVRFELQFLEKLEDLEPIFELVGSLAAADIYGVDALRGLDGAIFQPPSGPWNRRTAPAVVVRLENEIRLGPVVVDGRCVTRSESALCGLGLDRSAASAGTTRLRVDERGAIAGGAPTEELIPQAKELLAKAGAGVLTRQGSAISFTWETVETDQERLLAGARLVACLSPSPTRGVYR